MPRLFFIKRKFYNFGLNAFIPNFNKYFSLEWYNHNEYAEKFIYFKYNDNNLLKILNYIIHKYETRINLKIEEVLNS